MTEGIKHDQGKAPMGLLPMKALTEVAKVMDYGAKKYSKHNWRKGMDWSRLYDANLRHLSSFIEGEDADHETSLSHLAHAACCNLFLLEYVLRNVGTDDRFKPIPTKEQEFELSNELNKQLAFLTDRMIRTNPRIDEDNWGTEIDNLIEFIDANMTFKPEALRNAGISV